MPQEGDTATGPEGAKAVFRNGRWEAVPAQRQPPGDPKYPYEGATAAADMERSQAEARLRSATLGYDVRRAAAEAAKAEAEAARGPQPTATEIEQGARREGERRRANTVRTLMGDVRSLYETNLKGQPATRLFGATEKLGFLPANEEFNAAANNILPLIRPLVAQTAKEGDSDREMFIFQSYIPSASDSDRTIERKLRGLEILIAGMVDGKPVSQLIQSGEFADGLDGKGVYGGDLGTGPPPATGSVWENTQEFVANDPLLAAEFGASKKSIPIPPEMQAEHRAFVASGNWTPEDYARFRIELDRKYADRFSRTDPLTGESYALDSGDAAYSQYLEGGKALRQQLDAGGNISDIPPSERDMTLGEKISNRAVNNPVGAVMSGAFNMGGLGGIEALAPEQYEALAEKYPWWQFGGELGGVISGTAALGKAGREAIGLIPRGPARLRQIMGREGSFKRNLATDAAYGAGYGTVTEGDPLEGAIEAGVGSAGGQAVGRTLGSLIGGVRQSTPIENLLNQGITVSTMRRLGQIPGRLEDAATSIPVLGDLIERRTTDAFGDLNRTAFGRLGARETGEEGLAQIRNPQRTGTVDQAYAKATPADLAIPVDAQFIQMLSGTAGEINRILPEDAARVWNKLVEARLGKVTESGTLTGADFQKLMRTVKAARNKPVNSALPFESEWRESLDTIEQAARDLMERQGAKQAVDDLREADRMYRDYSTLKDAVGRARKGTGGEIGQFTPSQLIDAGHRTKNRYPGPRPFADIADDAQRVLPSKIPDSGTARRVLIGTGLTGAGAGAGAALSPEDRMGGAQTGAGLAGGGLTLGAFLSLLYTRKGQNVLDRILFSRPETARDAGTFVRKLQGPIGSGSMPLLLGSD